MTDRADQAVEAPALYEEPGSTWWPLAWGPGFALVGAGIEVLSGPVHVLAWVLAAAVLFVISLIWVQARRRVCSVRLTGTALYQGQEPLEVNKIAEVDDVESTPGARILGGGWTVPKKYVELPLRLTDDTVVMAWAKDAEALRAALRPLVAP